MVLIEDKCFCLKYNFWEHKNIKILLWAPIYSFIHSTNKNNPGENKLKLRKEKQFLYTYSDWQAVLRHTVTDRAYPRIRR